MLCPVMGGDAWGWLVLNVQPAESRGSIKLLANERAWQMHLASQVPVLALHVPIRLLSVVPQKPCEGTKAPVLAAAALPAPAIIIIVEQTPVSTHRRWLLVPSLPRAMLVSVFVWLRQGKGQ